MKIINETTLSLEILQKRVSVVSIFLFEYEAINMPTTIDGCISRLKYYKKQFNVEY